MKVLVWLVIVWSYDDVTVTEKLQMVNMPHCIDTVREVNLENENLKAITCIKEGLK